MLAGEWVHWLGDYRQALKVSQKTGRPLLVLMVSKDCGGCRKVLTTAFRDTQVAAWVNRHTVPVIVTKEFGNYPVEMLYTLDYPTLFLMDSEERFLKKPLKGAVEGRSLREWLMPR